MARFLDKLKTFVGMDGVEDYEEDDYFDELDEESSEETVPQQRSGSLQDDEDDDTLISSNSRFSRSYSGSRYSTEATATRAPLSRTNSVSKEEGKKVVNIGASQGLRVVLSKPTEFDNCQGICSHLRAQMTVVLNLEYVSNTADRKRIFDFISGCCYALDGNIQKVSDLIYIVAPCSVDVFAELNKSENDAAPAKDDMDFTFFK